MPSWSDQAYAKSWAKEEWAYYEPTLIPVELFLKRWLAGMANDQCLAATNWNAQLCGHEIQASELKREFERFDA